MTNYVLCYVRDFDHILLIRKTKPEWQKGRLNFPGGHIEPGETPEQAAVRELREEAGLECGATPAVGRIEGSGWVVHVVQCNLPNDYELDPSKPVKVTDEGPVNWHWLHGLYGRDAIPNLRVIHALIQADLRGWILTDKSFTHHFGLTIAA